MQSDYFKFLVENINRLRINGTINRGNYALQANLRN